VYKREYPQGKLLAQTVGFTGYEGLGFMGVERTYQDLLSSNDTSIYLTIDSSLQFVAEKALEEAIIGYHARGGVVVIQDPRSGKILSLAASPSFDPNAFETTDETLFRNAAVSEPVEPGSIFKIFFIAHLLDRFQLDLDKPYFYCEEETVLGNGEVIRDFKSYGWVGFRDIVKYSINGGIIQATRGLSKREMYDFLWSAQFGQTTGIDLPFEHKGILRPTKEWGIRTAANIPMGQGVAVTSIQLISSFSALVNGGVYHKPYVLERYTAPARFGGMATNWTEASASRRIVSVDASKRVTSLLSYGTMRGSTGYRARESGYDAGGKTSTSQQVNLIEGGYFSNRFNALFIAAFPEEEPRATVLVVIFDPQDAHSGGQVAAPVFARLVPDLIRFAGLPTKGKMETYQNRILKIAREETRTKGNLVPDFRGLSLRSALALGQSLRREVESHSFNVRVESSGSGYVRNQSPAPGTPVTGDTLIRLVLGEP
ncbi:MAG: PASTA domain-containing protein, partial [Spirochaetia bacterium]|nr:PASTA domain-containing protein [Spirochaetia bacterium]